MRVRGSMGPCGRHRLRVYDNSVSYFGIPRILCTGGPLVVSAGRGFERQSRGRCLGGGPCGDGVERALSLCISRGVLSETLSVFSAVVGNLVFEKRDVGYGSGRACTVISNRRVRVELAREGGRGPGDDGHYSGGGGVFSNRLRFCVCRDSDFRDPALIRSATCAGVRSGVVDVMTCLRVRTSGEGARHVRTRRERGQHGRRRQGERRFRRRGEGRLRSFGSLLCSTRHFQGAGVLERCVGTFRGRTVRSNRASSRLLTGVR